MYYIFSFKSRTSAMNFYDTLKKNNIPSVVINTPPTAQIGCGLSVKVYPEHLNHARDIFARLNIGSYLGLFKITYTRGRYHVDRI